MLYVADKETDLSPIMRVPACQCLSVTRSYYVPLLAVTKYIQSMAPFRYRYESGWWSKQRVCEESRRETKVQTITMQGPA